MYSEKTSSLPDPWLRESLQGRRSGR